MFWLSASRRERNDMPFPSRIISGGQTGVDRAALDVALALDLPCGGWCPRGRRAEDGPIPARYPLRETPSENYSERTEWNVRDSDGTLVLLDGPARGGTALTIRIARTLGKPHLIVDPREEPGTAETRRWIEARAIGALNVAGPRESEAPGIHGRARAWLEALLRPGCQADGSAVEPEEPDAPARDA